MDQRFASKAPMASRGRHLLKRFALATSLAALSLAASVAPAGAAVTIGQLAPGIPPLTCFNAAPYDMIQPAVTSGNSYVVPATGGVTSWTVTSWSHNAAAGAGQRLALKVFRKVADPTTYQVVGHDGPRSISPATVNTFTGLSLPVKPGDVLGLQDYDVPNACFFAVPGETHLEREGDLADGQSGEFIYPFPPGHRLNISAVVAPSNSFTFGKAKLNKKKGTATLTINVPNPGELSASGKGVKAAAAGATISKAVTPGAAQLLIKAKGKKKRKLNEKGKVKLNVAVTYTPTGGDPSTQSIKVKLKKKL
jgi:hypothetical protein